VPDGDAQQRTGLADHLIRRSEEVLLLDEQTQRAGGDIVPFVVTNLEGVPGSSRRARAHE
jgi:hypothetical protein